SSNKQTRYRVLKEQTHKPLTPHQPHRATMQRSPRSASTLSLVTRVHQAFHRLTPAEQRELTLYPPDPAMQTPEPETHTTPTRPPRSHMTMPGKPGGRICCRLPFQWVPGRLRFVSDRPSRSLRCSRRATGINLR